MSADELPSWRETTAKQSIAEFVAAATDPDSPDFVPERDRVAVFDNDGTLWTEKPVDAQLVFALDRAAELGHPTSLEELHAGGMAALMKLLALTHAGITTDEFDAVCRSWLASARHPRFGRPYPATVYQPMVELLGLLDRNGFSSRLYRCPSWPSARGHLAAAVGEQLGVTVVHDPLKGGEGLGGVFEGGADEDVGAGPQSWTWFPSTRTQAAAVG
jgi:hypothetical protein